MRTTIIYLWAGGLAIVGIMLAWNCLRREEPDTDDDLSLDANAAPPRSLDGRIVVCANCDEKTTLYTSSSGQQVCSTCGSPSWLFQLPRTLPQLVNEEEEIRQLNHLYSLLPNDLPMEVRADWVADVKRRIAERIHRAGGDR